MATAKKGKCLGRYGASCRHTTKLKQSIFFRYLWPNAIKIADTLQIALHFCYAMESKLKIILVCN
jgi:hypothetical protein